MTTTTAILISSAGLLLAAAVFWRAGGGRSARRMAQRLQRDIPGLAARPKRLVDQATQSLAEAYEQNRRRLACARDTLRRQKGEACSGLEKHVALAGEHLEALSILLEDNARAATHATLAAARRTQRAIARRIQRLEARVLLLWAEAKAQQARRAVIDQQFTEAEGLLDQANELIARASDQLAIDPHDQVMVERIRRASREAVVSLRAHAEFTVRKMDRLLAESDRLVGALETDEAQAAGPSSTPAAPPSPPASASPSGSITAEAV